MQVSDDLDEVLNVEMAQFAVDKQTSCPRLSYVVRLDHVLGGHNLHGVGVHRVGVRWW